MAIIVAAERGWITRDEAANRLALMLGFLERAPCYHGLFPHYMNGRTGATITFGRKDDGSDIVETSFLFQGLFAPANISTRTTPPRNACAIGLPGCGSTPNGTGIRATAAMS